MNTTYYKNGAGWNARTTVQLAGNAELTIHTGRSASGHNPPLCTVVSGAHRDASGALVIVREGGDGDDYLEEVDASWPLFGATRHAVRKQHANAIRMLPAILDDAEAHYARLEFLDAVQQ